MFPAPRPRIPAFHPVPTRARADGWTPVRQAEFVGMLAQTGSVSAAAAFVGMSRESAYRLRRRAGAEEFARAWDTALDITFARRTGVWPSRPGTRLPRKVTGPPCWKQGVEGLWRPVLRRGTYVGSVHKPDNSALLGYLAQLDRVFRAEQKDIRRKLRSQAKKSAPVSQGRRGK